MTAAHRLQRTLIEVTGPDARAFLENLLTQDLERLDEAGVLYAALLSPQGKLIADMFLWARAQGGALLDVDPARGADLLRRLSMYKLRANAVLADVSETHAVFASDSAIDGARPDPRLAAIGWRQLDAHSNARSGDDAYRARLLALGVPDLARDAAPEEVFALEALLEELNAVAFHKGCFVGQENVSRMKRRATTRKKFCPVAFEGPAPPFGAPILAGDAEIGTVRSGRTGRAMALLRLDRALAAEVLTAGGREVRLDPPAWLLLPQPTATADRAD
ncbi:MAG: hypothetical protein K2P58_10950 [Hyphomonadaceae bacterium]|nr:hypothetical protein [Hyphomonadaceae bacterium]